MLRWPDPLSWARVFHFLPTGARLLFDPPVGFPTKISQGQSQAQGSAQGTNRLTRRQPCHYPCLRSSARESEPRKLIFLEECEEGYMRCAPITRRALYHSLAHEEWNVMTGVPNPRHTRSSQAHNLRLRAAESAIACDELSPLHPTCSPRVVA